MFGKIFGAIAGAKAAEHSRNVGGGRGAILGAAAVPLLRRAGLPALIALGAGGYALKKYKERKDAEAAKRESFETPPRTSSAAA